MSVQQASTFLNHSKLCLALLAMLIDLAAFAQSLIGVQLLDPDPLIGSCFGRSVAMHDDYVFVGEPDPGGEGRIHVFHRNTGGLNNWGWLQTILPPPTTGGQSFSTGKDFGHLCVIGDGNLVVLRPRRSFYVDQIDGWVCSDHLILVYRKDEDGNWTLHVEQGGELMSSGSCPWGGACTYDIPILSGSSRIFARSQPDLDTGGPLPGQGPVRIPGVTISYADYLGDDPTLLFSGSSRLLAATGDTVIIEGLRIYLSEPPLLIDSIELAEPDMGFDHGTNPLSTINGILALGNRHDDSLGLNAGSVLIYDLANSPPSYTGSLFGTSPSAGRHFGSDVELKGPYMAVLSQEDSQPAFIEMLQQCTTDIGWCSMAQYNLPSTSPIVPDAFRLSGQGEFVVSTSQGVYLYFNPGIALYAAPLEAGLNGLEIISVDRNHLKLKLADDTSFGTLSIFDANGRQVLAQATMGQVAIVPISMLAGGVYALRLTSRHIVYVAQFVKP